MLRHTAAMQLLNSGIDTSVIALWLGHESVETTQIYLHADLALKEKALARIAPPNTTPGRYRPPDTLLAFLRRYEYAEPASTSTTSTSPDMHSAMSTRHNPVLGIVSSPGSCHPVRQNRARICSLTASACPCDSSRKQCSRLIG